MEKGKCSYLHDETIRGVHDRIKKAEKKGNKIPLGELREMLIKGFNKENQEHVEDILPMEEALNRYPEKPSF